MSAERIPSAVENFTVEERYPYFVLPHVSASTNAIHTHTHTHTLTLTRSHAHPQVYAQTYITQKQ